MHFERLLKAQLPLTKTRHFNFYYPPASFAERELGAIKAGREHAYTQIAAYLAFDEDLTIDLYLFESEAAKTADTGSVGAGLAYGLTMVEVYSEQIKVNPYHELTHVIMDYAYGESASAFCEGLAVYLCNLFGDMESLDGVSGEYREKVRACRASGELFSLRQLLSLEIGSEESKPFISYPQAASFVEFAIARLGKDSFLNLYAALSDDCAPQSHAANAAKLEGAFGQSIEYVEREWLGELT